MNRIELLSEIYNQISHNLYCYSANGLKDIPKEGYEEEWHREQEKLEIIEGIMQEENKKEFQLYTSIYNLYHEREKRINIDLAYLEDRKNGISCHLTLRENDIENKLEYKLVFTIHKKDAFDDERENVYSRDIKKEAFKDRETLKKEMQDGLEFFKQFIEKDKSKDRLFSEFYKSEETEEFE